MKSLNHFFVWLTLEVKVIWIDFNIKIFYLFFLFKFVLCFSVCSCSRIYYACYMFCCGCNKCRTNYQVIGKVLNAMSRVITYFIGFSFLGFVIVLQNFHSTFLLSQGAN